MRIMVLLTIAALAGSCSCQREGEEQAVSPAVANTTDAADTANTARPSSDPAALESRRSAAASVSRAVSGLHAYLSAVAGKDWTKADAHWTGGKPPPRPDDHALRAVEDLRSMRINNATPVPLDQELPPRALEVPVTLRVRRDDGTQELKGWYRLRRKVDSDDWEITSASLQPTLD